MSKEQDMRTKDADEVQTNTEDMGMQMGAGMFQG